MVVLNRIFSDYHDAKENDCVGPYRAISNRIQGMRSLLYERDTMPLLLPRSTTIFVVLYLDETVRNSMTDFILLYLGFYQPYF